MAQPTAPKLLHVQDRYTWRLYTAAAAGMGFFAGMLANNWLQRHFIPIAPAVPGGGEK